MTPRKPATKPRKEDAERSMLYSYTYGFSGFSAKLNSTQAASLAKMNQVITVFKSKSLKLHTTRSWDFLGLTVDGPGHNPPPQLAYGSDVVVGIFDTGIWPESESFREPPDAKPIPSSWNGECVGGGDVHCNRKLIGARFYLRGFEETYGELDRREYRSPRDGLGHGTHTASTAVGSLVSDVSGFAAGTARGGAPSARLAVYKTCWGKDLEGSARRPISWRLSTTRADIGAFHAAERGVSVVFSGGNDGPDPGLVQNVAPWAVSVAASTMDRSFPTRIVIDGGYTLTGQSLVSQEITGTLALATTYFDGGVCKWENWLKKLANETIILCFSTLGPVQFIEEAQAAAIRANASALIFAASPTKQLVEEVDKIPTVRVDILSGTRIRNYLARSPTVPMVKVGPSKTVIGKITAPSVAYFSSRGPSSLSPDILKPDITAPGIGILGAWPPKTPPTLSTRTIKRTVSNVGPNKNTVYFVDIVRPVGVEVEIWPRILVFSKCQQEHSYYVTFKPTKTSSGRYVFGEIVWTNGFHRVRSPLVVFLSNGGFVAK
ncbi:hypothetical protein Bca52824_070226 [Brassica carinata]|uniref:Uncharacterized protein n=1 Tax=Brassica carinata TaxID=52824 RepID=A0A8X7U224_BRACI|nr:hypothetical protein Bca52824_070226 [Brassica carinata]